MRRRLASAFVLIALQACCLAAPARAQDDEFPCTSFSKNPDGSWTVRQPTFIPGPNFSVRLGAVFRPGENVRGYDLVGKLNQACRDMPPAPPPGAAQGPPPRALLSRFADANGNIDVRRLTCGDLADTSNEEAELLFAWYSGVYGPPAKKSLAVNLARLRYLVRSTVDYCRTNREINLVQVMDHFLK